jgi:trimethylamine:corrinoid methyltransferase-like protein
MPVITGKHFTADLDRRVTFKAGKVQRSFVAIDRIDGGTMCFVETYSNPTIGDVDNVRRVIQLGDVDNVRRVIQLLDDGARVGSGRRDSRVGR